MNSYDVTECQPHTAATALLGMRPSGHLGGSPPIKTFRSNLAGKMGPTPLQLDVVGSDVHQPESRFRILQQTHWWELIPFEARACWTTAPEKCGHCNNPEMKIMRSLKKDWPFGWFWLKRIVMSINIELIRTPLMSPHTSKRFAEVALSCFGLKKGYPRTQGKVHMFLSKWHVLGITPIPKSQESRLSSYRPLGHWQKIFQAQVEALHCLVGGIYYVLPSKLWFHFLIPWKLTCCYFECVLA